MKIGNDSPTGSGAAMQADGSMVQVWAQKRFAKLAANQLKQTPGRVQPPPKPLKFKNQ